MKRSRWMLIPGLLLVAVGIGWWLYPVGFDPAGAALAEYQVEKLSCGSCVQKIDQALKAGGGVGEIEVSLTSGRCRVVFDPSRISSDAIARRITEAGYPARLLTELSPEEYAGLRQQQARLGAKYVAKVGSRLVSRDDFETALRQRLGEREVTPALLEQLRRQLWNDLRQREMLLAEAEAEGILVQPGEVDARLAQLRKGHANLDELIAQRFGDMETFRRQLREDMTIERLVEEKVLAGITDPGQRQLRLQQWLGDLARRTDVVIFDSRLKRAVASGGDCDSGCCG
ncbi:cation transporter [Geothermobacter ehrlichii]|nr:cation transporter [Geothermobacter ehrlichii]